jgi:hypothetical protein
MLVILLETIWDPSDQWRLAGQNRLMGQLWTVPRHEINPEYLKYHREHFATP